MADNKTKIVITGEDRTKAAFSSINRQMGDLKNNAAQLGRTFGTVFGAISVGALVAMAKSGIDAADALNDMSQRLGVSVKDLASFKLAAEQSGTSLEGVGTGIARLTRSIGDAEGGNKKMAAALQTLGVTARDPKEAFFQLADAVQRIEDPSKRAALLSQVLGKSYQELVPLLNQGSDALRESALQSATFADQMAKLAPDADKFNDQMAQLKINAAGAGSALLIELVPALNEVFQRIGLVKNLIGAGGLFNTLNITAGTGEISEVMRRLKRDIKETQDAIEGERARGKDASPFEEKLRGLNAQLDVMKKNSRDAALALGDQFKNYKVPQTPRKTDPRGSGSSDADKAAAAAAAKAAAAARQEAAALVKAQESLEKARLDAAAKGLEDGLTARREKLDQARKAELIDEAGFIAAKAALDEEGLRNELAALQAQRDKLRAQSTDQGSKASERTQALAELALVEARILSASDKILNLNQAATAELTALGVAKLKSQADFLDGLEQEAYLSGLNNDERETALLLLEAEKLGIADVNRLLELQGQLRANANAKQVAEELKRQQDDLYKSVQDGVQRAFADGLNAVATGGARDALKNAVDTIRSAMSNALAGGLTDSFLGMLGGKQGVLNIAGSLGLGGKRDGSSEASAVYVKDVGAGGLAAAAGGTGGEGGGLFAGLGNLLSGLFNGIKAALTSLVSSIGNALSGLFGGGGGGGGQNWIGAIASLFGYAEGGWTGPGSKYQPAGFVHADEFVFDKASTNRIGVDVLENMRRLASGRFVSSRPRMGYAEGGAVNLPGAAAPNVSVGLRNINFFDLDSAMSDYLRTRGGERAILNIIQRNPAAAGG